MTQKIFFVLLLLCSFAMAEDMQLGHTPYGVSELLNGATNKESHYDTLSIPDLSISSRCYENCKQDCCYPVLVNQKNEVVRSFSTSDVLGLVAHTRYVDRSYLYYSFTTGSGKERRTTYHLVDNTQKSYKTPASASDAYDSQISLNAELLQITPTGLYVNGNQTLGAMSFEAGKIECNLKGDVALAGVDKESDAIFVSNMKKWVNSNIVLAKKSDRKGVLALHPQSGERVYVAAYNLVNIYNKGLMGADVDFATSTSHAGWIYNDEIQNIGFYPQMYMQDEKIYLLAQNSSNGSYVHFLISPTVYAHLDTNKPKNEGFEEEGIMDFMVGAGVSYLGWIANSKVEKDDKTYVDTEYEISNSLYKELYFQGRVGNTQLVVSYAQNEAEKKGGLTKKASQVLSAMVDFNGLISDSSALRLAYTKAEVNGITKLVTDSTSSATNVTPNNDITKEYLEQEFTTDLERIALLVMAEKGLYYGAEYTTFSTPAAIGFSGSSNTIEYFGLDSKMKMQNIEVVGGYDTAAYAKRYETDYSSFYFQGMGGIGASIYDLSSEFRSKVETASGKTIADATYSIVFDLELEAGYIWQQRFKSARGLGYSIELGAKLRGMYTGIGQSDESDSGANANELKMEMTRYDVWYGPYTNVSLVF